MTQTALVAAGCFWGVQFYFDQISGVTQTTVGYTGGHTASPTYEQVCSHKTGHAEAVEIIFDTKVISYEMLVKQFLYMHDPTQAGGQGPDIGDSYRSAIFYKDESQHEIAQKVIDLSTGNYTEPLATELSAASDFWPAEDYHQKFAERTGRGMCHKSFKILN